MILAETALSFLGWIAASGGQLGRDAKEAQSVKANFSDAVDAVARRGGGDYGTVFNFLGDGLRDAADPYH